MAQVSNERRAATASYIEGMLVELRSMSQQIEADLLAYLLEMAAVEANDVKLGRTTHGKEGGKSDKSTQTVSAEELAAIYLAKNA